MKSSGHPQTEPSLAITTLRAKLQPIERPRRPRKQRRLFRLAILRADAFEGVEDHLIAALALVRRKIAFEHGASGAEGLDAGFDSGTPRRRQILRRWGRRTLVEIVASQPHRQAAKFYVHVAAFRNFLDRGFPS